MTANPYLTGNFAPVEDEVTATDLRVSGEIPRELNGRFLRIGPNPADNPDPDTHHWFLGTGMVHGLRLEDGNARWFKSRYVRDDIVVAAKGWPPVAGPTNELALGGGVTNTILFLMRARPWPWSRPEIYQWNWTMTWKL